MPDSDHLRDFVHAAARLGVKVHTQEPLAKHTTFRIGGPADLYATAASTTQLEGLAALATAYSLPVTILGGGSNILVSDAGVRGLVIANQAREFGIRTDIARPDHAPGQAYLVADSGVLLAGLARWAIKHGWAGLEWAVSVPGTLAGAVIGNAGAHGGDMAGNVAWVTIWRPDTGRQVLEAEALGYTYRSSQLKQQLTAGAGPVVLSAGLYAQPGDGADMAGRAERYLAQRRASQPTEPSAGSIFRNPPEAYAGRLVEAAGLKGYTHGGAQVSLRHANFIINTGNASAADVVALMNLMRQRVHALTGATLVPEILFLGDWPTQPLCSL